MQQAPPRPIRDSDRARVGTVLHDKWTLERLIGVGGMGAVYAAKHRNGAKAAVKIFSPVHETKELRERFLREGYAANKVEHRGAVKVLDDDVIDKGADEGLAYLVMELLEGESLFDRSQREPTLTERDLLEIADAVLAVLEAAHANGVVHRDLKPDNLFLVKDEDRPDKNEIKVLDFGLARLLESSEQSWNGMAFGTPTYMSPEQAQGKQADIDGRTDIYALGSILFQLSSNKRIHDAAHTLGLVVRMATTPAPKLNTVAPDASPRYAAIVDKALAFDRDDRYANAKAMRTDVRAALTHVPAAQPSTVNIVSTEMRAPDSARVLPASTPREDAARPAFALRSTMPADSERALDAASAAAAERTPETTREVTAAEGTASRASTRPTVVNAGAAADDAKGAGENLATRAEPAVARAKHRAVEGDGPGGRVFSRTVLVFLAAALIGFVGFASRGMIFGAGAADAADAADAAGSASAPVDSASSDLASAPPAASSVAPLTEPSAAASADAVLDAADAGEDEDDDDDDDDDAGVLDASRSRGVSRPAAHPAAKKRPPRRPGAPRKTKKKRWHW